MLEEQGVVIEVFDQYAIIQTKPSNRCGQCAATHCGGTGLRKKPALVTVNNHQGAMVGDDVIIELEEATLLKSALAIYLLPLLGMFTFAIGYHILAGITPLPSEEMVTILTSLIGLVVGLKIAQTFLRPQNIRKIAISTGRSETKSFCAQKQNPITDH